MINDPAGQYAALGVDPAAAPEAIGAAYRRKARVLHPDVMGTGDATAFMRIKLAYDVLGDAARRAAYDRSALAPGVSGTASLEPAPQVPRLSDLPVALWVGLGGVFCLAAIMAMVQFAGPSPHPQGPIIRPFAPPAAVARPRPTPPPAVSICRWANDPLRAAGERRYRGVAARREARRLSACWLPPRVQLGRRGRTGSAARAGGDTPGGRRQRLHRRDAPGAGRPRGCTAGVCAYNAGPSPQNGEVLDRHGAGGVGLSISNRDAQPAVVKLRDPSGRTAATVYVAPGSTAAVANCRMTCVSSGLRHRRAMEPCLQYVSRPACGCSASPWMSCHQSVATVIPPDLSVTPAPADIPDAEFEHE